VDHLKTHQTLTTDLAAIVPESSPYTIPEVATVNNITSKKKKKNYKHRIRGHSGRLCGCVFAKACIQKKLSRYI
jgi:hypothetical protein